MTELTLSVPDISCGHCKSSIEGAVATVSGVSAVEVHIDERSVDVAFDDDTVTLAAIVEAIEAQGYAVAG
jgi:copper chaperone